MEKTCSITYGELLDKGFQVINLEGIIWVCDARMAERAIRTL